MITFTELVTSEAVRDPEHVSGVPRPLFHSIACALKCVLAADGEVNGAELNTYLETCRRFGAPDDMLQELRAFDPSCTTLEACFRDVDPDSIPARSLLYDAIRIAKADGSYDRAERAAVMKAAELLGLDDEWVEQITALIDAEEALHRIRVALLLPPGLRAYV
ncbi:MAG: TerB family tellurite resistance protein [Gemmatimonadetes bacterium]|nr:TerB family tellurite resistance protein [Gemmatimonadota bacterium]